MHLKRINYLPFFLIMQKILNDTQEIYQEPLQSASASWHTLSVKDSQVLIDAIMERECHVENISTEPVVIMSDSEICHRSKSSPPFRLSRMSPVIEPYFGVQRPDIIFERSPHPNSFFLRILKSWRVPILGNVRILHPWQQKGR